MHNEIEPLSDVVKEIFSGYGRKLAGIELLSVSYQIYLRTGCVVSEETVKRWNENYWGRLTG